MGLDGAIVPHHPLQPLPLVPSPVHRRRQFDEFNNEDDDHGNDNGHEEVAVVAGGGENVPVPLPLPFTYTIWLLIIHSIFVYLYTCWILLDSSLGRLLYLGCGLVMSIQGSFHIVVTMMLSSKNYQYYWIVPYRYIEFGFRSIKCLSCKVIFQTVLYTVLTVLLIYTLVIFYEQGEYVLDSLQVVTTTSQNIMNRMTGTTTTAKQNGS